MNLYGIQTGLELSTTGANTGWPEAIVGLTSWYDADSKYSVYADGAAQFTAADKHYLAVTDNATISATTVIEVGCWVYLDSVGNNRVFIFKGTSLSTAANIEYGLYYANAATNFRFAVSNGSIITTVTDTGAAPSLSTWYFLRAGLKSDGTLFIQRNGGTEDTTASCPAIQDSTNELRFGADTVNSGYMNGRIDSAYLTKTISSAAEVAALYNSGSGRMVSDLTAANGLGTFRTNCISWWGMNEDTGIRYDQIGTNHLTPAATNLIDATTLNGGFATAGTNGGTITNVTTVNVARTSNVATIEATAHGLSSTNVVTVTGVTTAGFNAAGVVVTVVDVDHFTYPNTGDDVGETADTGGRITTDVFANWTEAVAGASTISKVANACVFTNDASASVVGVSQVITKSGNKYKMTVDASIAATAGTLSVYGSAVYGTITPTTSTVTYTVYFTADSTTFGIKTATGASKVFTIDTVVLVSQGPASAAGIAAGLATDGNLCASFNGTSQYLSVASNATLQTGNIDFTVWGWVNLNSKPSSGYGTFFGKYLATGNLREYFVCYDASQDKFRLFTSPDGTSTGLTAVSDTTLGSPNVGTWYFVVAWHDSVADRIWIQTNNGTAVSANYASGLTALTAPFDIGDMGGGGSYFPGRIDGVGFIKRTLTAAEITSLYNNGKGCKYADLPASISGDSNLKGFWNLDEFSAGTGAVTRLDSTTNDNDLTDTGTTPSGQGVKYYEGAVGKWVDQSASSYHMTQTTQANKLLYRTNQMNSKAVVTGDALTKKLQYAGDLIGTGSVTVFAVIKPRGWGGGNLGRIIDNVYFILNVNSTSSRLRCSSDGASTVAYSANSSIALNTSYVVVVTRAAGTPTTVNLYINGTLSGTADQSGGNASAGTTTYVGNNAGGTTGFDGDIAEVGIYNSVLNTTQITSLTGYLRRKWGI